MMYNNKLAVAIKSAGKVLREHKDTVYLPFGCEYSIFVKNLNSVRVQVNITVDGQTVINGLVVNGNSEVEIERFVKENTHGNRLKFIQRTSKIEEHRGIKVEDGLIRVEFQFEKPMPAYDNEQWKRDFEIYEKGRQAGRNDPWKWPTYPQYYPWTWNTTSGTGGVSYSTNSVLRSTSVTLTSSGTDSGSITCDSVSMPLSAQAYNCASTAVSDAGITVPGSTSNQQFTYVSSFPLENEKHVIVLKLLGQVEVRTIRYVDVGPDVSLEEVQRRLVEVQQEIKRKRITTPITVKHKQRCSSCGRTNKATAKFCVECGTALTVV